MCMNMAVQDDLIYTYVNIAYAIFCRFLYWRILQAPGNLCTLTQRI
jgi:hypothetical protein